MAADKVMGKQKSCVYKDFVRGGSNHMAGKGGVGPQEPGVTATTQHSSSGSFLNSVKGGSGRMTGKKVTAVKPA